MGFDLDPLDDVLPEPAAINGKFYPSCENSVFRLHFPIKGLSGLIQNCCCSSGWGQVSTKGKSPT